MARCLEDLRYLDDPRTFVCPASRDQANRGPPLLVPLSAATDLSYGWTRRYLSTACRATEPLAADKIRGHHAGSMNAVALDSHIFRVTGESEPYSTRTIAGTSQGEGFLGVENDPIVGYLGIWEEGETDQ